MFLQTEQYNSYLSFKKRGLNSSSKYLCFPRTLNSWNQHLSFATCGHVEDDFSNLINVLLMNVLLPFLRHFPKLLIQILNGAGVAAILWCVKQDVW